MTLPDNILTQLDSFPTANRGPLTITGLPGDSRDQGSRKHRGVDIAGTKGTPILSVLSGTVISAFRYNPADTTVPDDKKKAGNFVIIRHLKISPGWADNLYYYSFYAHLDSINVTVNQQVNAGTIIGTMGNSGTSIIRGNGGDGTHLHFEFYYGGKQTTGAFTWEKARVDGIIPNLFEILQNTSNKLGVTITNIVDRARPSAVSSQDFKSNENYITPYITTTNSLEPEIQYELTRRRNAAETANVYMPFIKLTALTWVKNGNLDGIGNADPNGLSAWCPTLGIHGEPNMEFDDIYSTKSDRSIVGYATTKDVNGKAIRTKVLVEKSNTDTDPKDIPSPGIVSATTDRSTAGPMGVRGGLFRANLKINAYSVGQLNALLRYFLRPATRVVLEFGRMSTSKSEPTLNTFNWTRPLHIERAPGNTSEETGILDDIGNIAQLKASQRPFIDKYVYKNFGNYEILIGYVVNFKTKYTKDNVYEIDLTVHSVQQFEVPNKTSGTQPICVGTSINCENKVLDVVDYFDPASVFKINNFNDLLVKTAQDATSPWNNHVIPLRGQGTDSPRAGVSAPGFLLSWTFFVNKVLNDEKEGLLSVFQLNSTDDKNTLDIMRKSLLQPIISANDPAYRPSSTLLSSNEVGWHKNLRSTDPGVMVIYNPNANLDQQQQYSLDRARRLGFIATDNSIVVKDKDGKDVTIEGAANGNLQNRSVMYNFVTSKILEAETLNSIQASSGVAQVGRFNELSLNQTSGVSSLTKGVWLNSNVIILAFASTDTITAALEFLLTQMNKATEGYWNLQLLSNDIDNPGLHVIDMGLSKQNNQKPRPRTDISVRGSIENREAELKEFIDNNYLYLFNRKLQTNVTDDMGSELLDITLDIGLPQVVAVQAIAGVGGVASRATLQAIDAPELNTISLFELYPKCIPTTCTEDPQVEGDVGAVGYELTPSQIETIANEFIDGNSLTGTEPTSLDTVTKAKILNLLENIIPTDVRKTNQTVLAGARSAAESAVLNRVTQVLDEFSQTNPSLLAFSDKFTKTFGQAIDFCEYDKTAMVKKIDDTRNLEPIHAFNSSNLTKTTVDMTLPGISGIQLFQAFAVDRVPNILDKGYYVVTRVAHEFTLDRGWLTKLQGRFRYAPDNSVSVPASVTERTSTPTLVGSPSGTPSTGVTPSQRTGGAPPPFVSAPINNLSNLGSLGSSLTGDATIVNPETVPPWRRR